MTVNELIEKAIKNAESHILGKGSYSHELENGDKINCNISSASSRHSSASWGKVCFYYLPKGAKTYKRFSKEKALNILG